MNEQAIVLGERKSLVGVLNAGGDRDALRGRPLVVFLNSGIIHRIGGNRLTVEACRAVALDGFASLRFDLSAIGDSLPREDALDPLESAMADVRDALDHMEAAFSVKRFVLAGLCSGADHSIAYAIRDPRVVGLVLIDPSIPRTSRYFLVDYSRRLRKSLSYIVLPRNWWRLRHALGRFRSAAGSGNGERSEPRLVEQPAIRTSLGEAYRSFLAEGRRALVVLTAGIPEQHNYAGQLADAFPALRGNDALDARYMPCADHTFTSERQRELLASSLRTWLKQLAGSQ